MKKVAGITIMIFSFLFAATVLAEPIKLKLAVPDPGHTPTVTQAYNPWAELINNASQGTVKVEVYPGGVLGSNPRIQLKLVLDGVADICFCNPVYYGGRFPDDEIFMLPLMARDTKESSVVSQRLYDRGLLRGYDDFILLSHFTTGINYLHSTKPIRIPSDLKGLKVRAATKLQSQWVRAFGAVPMSVAGPEVAEALTMGVMDAVNYDNSALFTFRVVDVAKYHLMVPLGSMPLIIVMNKKKYDSLPSQGKAAFDKHGADIGSMWVKAVEQHVKEGVDKMAKDPDHSIITPNEKDLRVWKEALQPIVDDWMSKDSKRKILVKAFEEELARYRAER